MLAEVREILGHHTVRLCQFDQCQFGLVSPGSGMPMKKATKVLTNSNLLFEALHGQYCNNEHAHQRIEGSEAGLRRSTAGQVYPPQLVRVLCTVALQEEAARRD